MFRLNKLPLLAAVMAGLALAGCAHPTGESNPYLGYALLGYSNGYTQAYQAYQPPAQTYCFPVGYAGAFSCSGY